MAFFFCSAPWGPGSKGQISFNFNYKVNFKDFLYQTLCVFSQMKDTKNVRRDFHSIAWVMPQGLGPWSWGCPGGQNCFFFKLGHVAYQIVGDDKQNRMQVKFSS